MAAKKRSKSKADLHSDLNPYRPNPFCGSYGECLETAAKGDMWLDCSRCPRKTEQSLVTDFLGEAILLLQIFRPDVCKRFPRKKGVQLMLDTAHDAQQHQLPY